MRERQIFTAPIGRTVEGREILAEANFPLDQAPPRNLTLLIGGQHGNEPATVRLLESFLQAMVRPGRIATPVAVVAPANPDAQAAGTRYNARGVDLNRNCGFRWSEVSEEPPGPAAWSEPESRALRDFIDRLRPRNIVSLHWALAEIDADGPQSAALASAMWEAMSPEQRRPYRLRSTESQWDHDDLEHSAAACPGSLGQWCGFGLRYPDGIAPAMVTLELPADPQSPSRLAPGTNGRLEALHARWARDAKGYLEEVRPGVHAMLLAACHFLPPL